VLTATAARPRRSLEPQTSDPFTLQIKDKDLVNELDKAIIERVRTVVENCQDRDDDLLELHLLLEGISQPTGTQPWPNACELESTLVREFHTTLHASLSSACKQFPYCQTEAVMAGDEDDADAYERYINIKAQRDGYEDAIDDVLYTALESKYSPLYVGYSQDIVKSFELGYKDSRGIIVDPQDKDPDEDYEEQLLVTQDVASDGIEYRTITPWYFYTDPIDVPGPQIKDQCERTIERMDLTRESLLRGVKDFGYNSENVKKMLEMGPTGLTESSHKNELNEDKGLNRDKSDYWQCYQVVGRLPAILDTGMENRVPEDLQYVDFVWMVCPEHQIAFKRAFSPFPAAVRPYVIFNAFKKPNSLLGHGLVSLLRDLQNEMTALERFGINKLNLEATPMMSVPERWLTKYAKWKVAPGRLMPRVTDNVHEISPIVWDTTSQNYIMAWMERIDAYASRLAAAQSANSALAGKVRKATEVQFADAMMQTKFDLIQSNINRGVKEVFNIMAALLSQHAYDDEIPNSGGNAKVSIAQLRKNFRFIPQANAEGANSSLRLQKDMVVGQIARQSAVFQSRVMGGDLAPDWVLTHRQLIHAGWREPEELLGPKPAEIDPSMAPPHPKGKPPIESISYKDAPPSIRRQMEQQAGMQPATDEQMSPGMAQAMNSGAGGEGQMDPQMMMQEHGVDLEKQKRDHAHEVNIKMLDHMGKMAIEKMKLQHQAQQNAQDAALQLHQSEQDRALQAHEGQQTRETQIQQAKLRPPARSNGTGGGHGKTNSKR
jgi:hypothetical protein